MNLRKASLPIGHTGARKRCREANLSSQPLRQKDNSSTAIWHVAIVILICHFAGAQRHLVAV